MQTTHRSISYSIALATLLIVSGCMSGSDGWRFAKKMDVRQSVGLAQDKPQPPQMPNRLVSTWEDTVLTLAGKKPQRGFGGRILFFNETSQEPVRVEGQLVVYAYDENDREAHETHPTRRYVFPVEQFVKHESECQLGPSYSVWLPWDQAGGEQKSISLIARFEPKDGPLIVGDQTRHLLPGTQMLASGETKQPVKKISDIQLTEFTETSKVQSPPSLAESKRKSRVTSIALSNSTWQKRLATARQQESSTTEAESDSAQ